MSVTMDDVNGDTSFERLSSERLVIRRMILADIESFHAYRSDPEIARYQSWSDYTRENAIEFVTKQIDATPNVPGQWIQLSIVLGATDEHIGDLAFQSDEYDPRIVQMGVTLSSQHQHNGYALEAVNCLLHYLFNKLNKHRVYCIIDERNTASVSLFRKLGFRQEGHFIENVFFKGEWGNEYQFAMLKKEFKT